MLHPEKGGYKMNTRHQLLVVLTIVMLLPVLAFGQEGRRARAADIKYDVPDEPDINYEVLDNIDISGSPYGVVPLPESLELPGFPIRVAPELASSCLKPIKIYCPPLPAGFFLPWY